MTQRTEGFEVLQRFLVDRHDSNFNRVVKEFLGGSEEERFRAFMFTLTSAKIFANVILDGGEITPSNTLLVQAVGIQLAKLLEEQLDRDEKPVERN